MPTSLACAAISVKRLAVEMIWSFDRRSIIDTMRNVLPIVLLKSTVAFQALP